MPVPTLEALIASLPSPPAVPTYQSVAPDQMPEPFRSLLVHDRHMTIAMEDFHQCKITVRVLQRRQFDGWYARQILLEKVGSAEVVQGGIVRIHLYMLDAPVQAAILKEDTPLGHVLINNNVMRHIHVTSFLRLEPGPALAAWPGFDSMSPAWGRLGIIYCNHQPAIELFELVPGSTTRKAY